MLVKRVIGGATIEINIAEANEIYLDNICAAYITEPGISGILGAIYAVSEIMHMPLSAFIELTSYCNFSCPFCYINEPGYPHNQLPPFSALKPTLEYLVKAGLLHCVLSGGECLLHPDFSPIYTYLKESGVLVTVFTNGELLNDEMFALFSKYKPFKMEVSLYGNDDISYQRTTGTKNVSANQVFANVKRLKEMGVNVICKTPITRLTEQCYPEIQSWCENQDISFYTGSELMDTYSGIDRSSYLASNSLRAKLKAESDVAFFADREMMEIAYSEKKKKLNFDCSAGKTDVFIDSHYNLMPCMKAAWLDGWKFNIGELGIETAYQQLFDKIASIKGTPLQNCTGCAHHRVCQECFMTQYEYPNLQKHRLDYCKALKAYMKQVPQTY